MKYKPTIYVICSASIIRMRKTLLLFTLSIPFFLVILLPSCKKPVLFSNGNLSFSQDTVVFDTVFTTIGSTTQNFKIYNNENRTVNIEEVQLMGGSTSPFKLNFDGVPGQYFENIELNGNDSLFMFVEVTLDVNGGTLPMIVEDSIRFRTNGQDQYVNLAVWGQDAYFHYSEEIQVDTTWPNDKPHVIYDYAAITGGNTLTIQQGTDIFLHKGAILYVYQSELNINGVLGDEVTLQGDRLEQDYDDVAGQYYGIYFQEALPSTINYCNIKNGTAGIHLFSEDPGNTGYTLELTNSIITNCARYGMFIYSGAKVKAENCILSKNAFHSLFVLEGGDFNFNHCHLIGYGNSEESTPAVGISNFYNDYANNVTNVGAIDEGVITNSVIYGNLEHEIVIDTLNPNQTFTFGFNFTDNVIRSESIPTDAFYTNNIWNQNPLFKDIQNNDFQFWGSSPLNNNGNPTIPNTLLPSTGVDILGNGRTGPDIGAYEL